MGRRFVYSIAVSFSICLTGCGGFEKDLNGPPQNSSSTGNTLDGVSGSIESVTVTGLVYGTARLTEAPQVPLQVHFYIDGPQGSGAFIGSTIANLVGNNNQGINDRFKFQLSSRDANGQSHQLYAYALIDGMLKQLPDSPLSYVAYTPTAAGKNFYEGTLKARLQTSCGSCHSVTYDGHYISLANVIPALGGTALNNELINKASGGASHGGGNHCPGGKNSGLCADIQAWWNLEF